MPDTNMPEPEKLIRMLEYCGNICKRCHEGCEFRAIGYGGYYCTMEDEDIRRWVAETIRDLQQKADNL